MAKGFRQVGVYKAVRIHWVDSATLIGKAWAEKGCIPAPCNVISIGIITDKDKDGLYITASISDDLAAIGKTFIPWGCIEELQILPREYQPTCGVKRLPDGN